MKNLFLLLTFLISSIMANAQQIGDCTQDGDRIKVYDPSGKTLIKTFYVNSNEILAGFSSTMIVVSYNDRVKVYDSHGSLTKTFYILSKDWVKGVAGNNILVTDGSYTKTYSNTGQLLNTRY